jgi:prolyl 4-hydroxylase
MTHAAFTSLPADWQRWISENLARGCEPYGMANVMVRDGHFDLALVYAAIEGASDGRIVLKEPDRLEMPQIDTTSNVVQTSDRAVDILLTVREPRIVVLGNVLSAEECDALTAYCASRLARSPVVNDIDGSTQLHPNRTSLGGMIHRGETDLVTRIEARLGEIAQWPVERGEGLQVQHYEATHEYRPHFDWFDADLPGPRKHMEHGGQRLATFVLYLTDVEAGGGTAFPQLGLEMLPNKGGAVFFQNVDSRRQPDRRTLHAGSPVTRGVKVIANKWLRERVY